jgi:hypothetical protein
MIIRHHIATTPSFATLRPSRVEAGVGSVRERDYVHNDLYFIVFCLFFSFFVSNTALSAQVNPDSLAIESKRSIQRIAEKYAISDAMRHRLDALSLGSPAMLNLKVLEFDTLLTGNGDIACASLDPLNQILIGYANGRIERYDSLGISVQVTYTNQRIGRPSMIDASNPLQILVYYGSSQLVLVLNRNLVEISILDLNRLGYASVPSVGASRDGNLWIYDAITFQLKKLDMQGRLILEGARLQPERLINPSVHIYDFGDHLAWQTDHHLVMDVSPYAQENTPKHFYWSKLSAFLPVERSVFVLRDMVLERLWVNEFGDAKVSALGLVLIDDVQIDLLAPTLYLAFDKKRWALVRLRY